MGAIERLIQQKKFDSVHQKAAISLMFAANVISSDTHTFLKPFDLTNQQYNALRILRGKHPEPASPAYIKERLIDKSSDVSRLIDRLKAKGFVELKKCPSDARASHIFITTEGKEVLAAVDKNKLKLLGAIHKLTVLEAEQLNDLIDKILKE